MRAKTLLGVMHPIAGRMGISVARVSPCVDAYPPLCNEHHYRREDGRQLADNLASTEVVLTAEDIARIDEASALPVEYPGWMLDWQHQGRRPEKIFS